MMMMMMMMMTLIISYNYFQSIELGCNFPVSFPEYKAIVI